MNSSSKKRHQHYVWKYHLRSWSEDGAIWCRMGARCFRANIDRVAQQRDFYKMRELTDEDIRFLVAYIEKADCESLRELNFGWLEAFQMFTQCKQLIETNGTNDPEVTRRLEELEINLEENLHNGIEELTKPYLNRAKAGDLSFLEEPEAYHQFIYFLSVQYLRTARNKEKSLTILTNDLGVNFERIWSIFTHIAATNVAWSLVADKDCYSPVLLVAPEREEFITGDQPVINTYANPCDFNVPPVNFDMYFPLTPDLALYLTDRSAWSNSHELPVTQEMLKRLNGMMAEHSHRQIFGASKCAIE